MKRADAGAARNPSGRRGKDVKPASSDATQVSDYAAALQRTGITRQTAHRWQRLALAAARLKGYYAEQAKQRMVEGGKKAGRGRPAGQGKEHVPDPVAGQSRDKAAEQFGVSGRAVDQA